MLVSEAAKQLGISTQTLRLGLQQGKFPFGEAVLTTKPDDSKMSRGRYTYIIIEERLKAYLEGKDMVEGGNGVATSRNNKYRTQRLSKLDEGH